MAVPVVVIAVWALSAVPSVAASRAPVQDRGLPNVDLRRCRTRGRLGAGALGPPLAERGLGPLADVRTAPRERRRRPTSAARRRC